MRVEWDGIPIEGCHGQSLAGMLISAGHVSWRSTAHRARPRGLFCGIGVCFDCIAVVNGVRDVRLCQRDAADGDVIETQDDRGAPAERTDAS